MNYRIAPYCSLILLIAAGCDFGGPDAVPEEVRGQPVRQEAPGLASFTVHTAGSSTRVLLAPFDSLEAATPITADSASFGMSRLAPDGGHVLFAGIKGVTYSGQAYLLDLKTGKLDALVRSGGHPMVPEMSTVFWSRAVRGFYFVQRAGISGQPIQYLHSLDDGSTTSISTNHSAFTAISSDTLVASRTESLEQLAPLDLLDAAGSVIGTIPADSLQDQLRGITGGLSHPDWNPVRRLLAFEIWDRASKVGIGISDLGGSTIIVSQPGEGFYDRRPRWGPNGMLVFDRSVSSDYDAKEALLMVFDLDARSLRTLLAPSHIPGATGISHFDWIPSPDGPLGLSPLIHTATTAPDSHAPFERPDTARWQRQ